MAALYAGEQQCVGIRASRADKARCTFKAFYAGQLCKVHSRSIRNCPLLPANPNKAQLHADKLTNDAAIVLSAAAQNKAKGCRGTVVCSKLRMRHSPEDMPGFRKIFPNNKHGNRSDGYGCATLSPMRMGPVAHGQPGLPPALNIENLHQGNKVFPSEATAAGDPTPEWHATRLQMYRDPEPHRHKPAAMGSGQTRNVPLYSVWRLADGTDAHFTYLDSRQFYCYFYEKFALASPEFKQLQEWLDQGVNLQIVGYDARPVDRTPLEMYKDTSAPFGHELVLYTLLTIQDPLQYPWRICQTVPLS